MLLGRMKILWRYCGDTVQQYLSSAPRPEVGRFCIRSEAEVATNQRGEHGKCLGLLVEGRDIDGGPCDGEVVVQLTPCTCSHTTRGSKRVEVRGIT
jgi:hypothetical protein